MAANQYYDQVIYIQSMCYRAHWFDAHHSGECHFTEAPQSDVINEVWSKWFVRKGPSNIIVFESLPSYLYDRSNIDYFSAGLHTLYTS